MAFGYIYKIVNRVNGMIYIGQTRNSINTRFIHHKSSAKRQKTYLYNAMNKYGVENFTIEQIDTASSIDELNEKEIYWIKKLNTKKPNGYNMVDGGNSVSGLHHTEKTKQLLRIKSTGNHNALGKHNVSVEGRKNMSLSHKGQPSSFKNRHHTLDARKKLSTSHNKKVLCVETNIIYPSSLIASNILGIANKIGCCCKGQRKTCGGYHWKWA